MSIQAILVPKVEEPLLKRPLDITLSTLMLNLWQRPVMAVSEKLFAWQIQTSLLNWFIRGGRSSMEAKSQKVSAFEAKTKLSELLRETEQGGSFVIYRRGKEVARLVPPAKEEQEGDLKQVLSSFREIRERIPRKVSIRQLVEKGRRF
jgi:prevent-host-death family protein